MANPLRAEFEPNGQPNVPEFGTVKEEACYRALKAMDGYHHVETGRRYPPVLMTTGLNDARVAPHNAGKMVDRLLAADPHDVALLSVDMAGGHNANASTRDKTDRDSADMYAFAAAAMTGGLQRPRVERSQLTSSEIPRNDAHRLMIARAVLRYAQSPAQSGLAPTALALPRRARHRRGR